MPFESKAQERAAFSGALGKEMKDKAPSWAAKTDQKNLPEHKDKDDKKMNPLAKIARDRMAKHLEPDSDEMGGPSDKDADNKHGITIAIGLPMHGKK